MGQVLVGEAAQQWQCGNPGQTMKGGGKHGEPKGGDLHIWVLSRPGPVELFRHSSGIISGRWGENRDTKQLNSGNLKRYEKGEEYEEVKGAFDNCHRMTGLNRRNQPLGN